VPNPDPPDAMSLLPNPHSSDDPDDAPLLPNSDSSDDLLVCDDDPGIRSFIWVSDSDI
jgi:hypothetical protein